MKEIKKKFRFRDFQVYKDGKTFVYEVKMLSKKYFPPDERFGLTSQLWRAADSIILNIAEGTDRNTDKDFALFLNHSHTSLNEVVACLDVATDNGYITEMILNDHLQKAAQLVDQLTALRKKLLTDNQT